MSVTHVIEAFNHLLDFSPFYFYSVFFGMAVLEGPITTFVFSAAASATKVSIWLIIFLSIFGDELSDIFWYYLGWSGRENKMTKKYLSGENTGILKKMEKMSDKNPWLFYFLIKTIPSWATPGLYYLGYKKENFKRYVFMTFAVTTINVVVLSALGYFSVISLRDFDWAHSWYRGFSITMTIFIIYVWVNHHHQTKNFLQKIKVKIVNIVTK